MKHPFVPSHTVPGRSDPCALPSCGLPAANARHGEVEAVPDVTEPIHKPDDEGDAA